MSFAFETIQPLRNPQTQCQGSAFSSRSRGRGPTGSAARPFCRLLPEYKKEYFEDSVAPGLDLFGQCCDVTSVGGFKALHVAG